jgi:hypothetical protein
MMLRLSSLCVTISLVFSVMASTDRTICAWFQSRSGTVRDALFIDGGTLINNTWDGTAWANSNPDQWNPKGIMYEFNYSASFEYSDSPPDVNTLLQLRPLAVDASRYDAPLYRSGAMFTDDFELYTYG